jgi:hypothetical protein
MKDRKTAAADLITQPLAAGKKQHKSYDGKRFCYQYYISRRAIPKMMERNISSTKLLPNRMNASLEVFEMA